MPPLHDAEKQKQINYDHIFPNVKKNCGNSCEQFQDKAYFCVSILEKRREEKRKLRQKTHWKQVNKCLSIRLDSKKPVYSNQKTSDSWEQFMEGVWFS